MVPRGVTPVQVTQFYQGQRYQILPAYSQDGIALLGVFQNGLEVPRIVTMTLPGKHLHHVLSLIFTFTTASHEMLRQVVQQRGTASLAVGALTMEVRLGDLFGFDEA